MTRKFWLAAMAILCMGKLNANECRGDVEISGSFLYLKPTFDDTVFVVTSPGGPNTLDDGERKKNDYDHEPAFRLGATYECSSCFPEIGLFYTHLCSEASRTVDEGFLFTPFLPTNPGFRGYQGSAKAKSRFNYHLIDAQFSRSLFCKCCLDIDMIFGVEYAYLSLKQKYKYQSDSPSMIETFEQRSKLSGIGPLFGLSAEYALGSLSGQRRKSSQSMFCGDFSLTAGASAAVLVGNVNSSVKDDFEDSTNVVTDDPRWRGVPALHANFGLKYEIPNACYDSSLEVGYQVDCYLRGRSRLYFYDCINAGNMVTGFYNYSLHGLYVTASVEF